MILNEFCDIFKDTKSWDERKNKMIKFAGNDYSLVGKLFEKFAKYYFYAIHL